MKSVKGFGGVLGSLASLRGASGSFGSWKVLQSVAKFRLVLECWDSFGELHYAQRISLGLQKVSGSFEEI